MAKLKAPANTRAAGELIVLLNADGMTDWAQDVVEGSTELENTPKGILFSTSDDSEGMISGRFLVSDEGDYSVSASFGFTGQQIQSLNSAYTQIKTEDQLYTGEARTTPIEVWYRGTQLVENTDYTIGSYANNVEVSASDSKATVEIKGIGSYSGTTLGEFAINYLPLDESWITVSGQMGQNNCYTGSVSVLPAGGYEFVVNGTAVSSIDWSEDGQHTETFRVRRISDGAMTDLVTRTAAIDKTAPTGSITLDQTAWSKFVETITFGRYKLNNLAATIEAADDGGVDAIEYVITETAYDSTSALEAANLNWSSYSALLKPTLKENKDQILYVRITDKAGNVSYLSTDGIHVDTTAPEVTVAATTTTDSAINFILTSSEAGAYYYLAVAATDAAPTVEQIKNGSTGTIPAASVGQPVELTAGGLSQNKTYVIYAVVEDSVFMLSTGDAAPNTSAVASTGPTKTNRLALNETNTVVTVEDAVYTGSEVRPSVAVEYKGSKLQQNVDYIVEYFNNTDVSDSAPYAKITGINDYEGSLTESFAIDYLPLDESMITVYGVAGTNDFYVSDVTILPATGYEFIADDNVIDIDWTADGQHSQTFRVRRITDGAMTDLVTRSVNIDKTAPTGTVTMDQTVWSKLVQIVTFGHYKVVDLSATVTAEDANGIAKTEYVIASTAYAGASELEAANLSWKGYSALSKPVIQQNADQIVYVRITDKAGNVSYLSTDGIHADTLAPVVSAVINSTTASGLSFTVTSSEPGRYYYAVQEASAADPSAAQILAQNVPGAKVGTGNVTVDNVGTAIPLSVTDLKPNNEYVVYVVAEDTVVQLSDGAAAANVSAVIVSDSAKTAQYILSDDKVVIQVENMPYTSNPCEPSVTVYYDGRQLTEGVDYEISFHDNVEPSNEDPYVEIKGIGEYAGTLTESFAISYLPAENNYKVSGSIGDNGYYTSAAAVEPEDGYTLVPEGSSALSFTEDGDHVTKFRVRRNSDGALSDVVTLQINVDTTAPTGSVTVATNVWTELLNTITFGLFFNETQEAKIAGQDAASGMKSVEYVVSEQKLDANALAQQSWTEYTQPVALDADGNYIVYAKLTDKAGNIAYIGSDGLVIDTQAPGVSGIVNGGEYSEEVTFTVDNDTVSVTIDGQTVYDENSTDNEITISASERPQKIVVTDRAGNKTELTVTVYPIRIVTFKADGNVVATIRVAHDTDLSANQFPAIPTKVGYDQTAPVWDHTGEDITVDTTINAVYTINKYIVTYVADGWTVETQTVEYGKDATAPEIPAKVGYDQTAPVWDHDGKSVVDDITITAVYTINTYKVVYMADGNVVSEQTVEHGADTAAPEVPSKSGYTAKWNHNGKNITADTTITAEYSAIIIPIAPVTGDQMQLVLWASMAVVSMGMIIILIKRRKDREEE